MEIYSTSIRYSKTAIVDTTCLGLPLVWQVRQKEIYKHEANSISTQHNIMALYVKDTKNVLYKWGKSHYRDAGTSIHGATAHLFTDTTPLFAIVHANNL